VITRQYRDNLAGIGASSLEDAHCVRPGASASSLGSSGATARSEKYVSYFDSRIKFPDGEIAISEEASAAIVKRAESGARGELTMGIGSRFEVRKHPISPGAIDLNRCSARDHAESRA
jgi:hypothetical protein